MGDFVSDLLMRQVEDQNGVLLPARATLRFAGTDVSVADVGGETVATFGLNAGVINGTVTTTNATPTNIELTGILSEDPAALDTIGIRVTGYVAATGAWIRRDMVAAISDGNWLKVGGAGGDVPYSDGGTVYHGAGLATAVIGDPVDVASELNIPVTGVAATTIKWQVRAWKESVTL